MKKMTRIVLAEIPVSVVQSNVNVFHKLMKGHLKQKRNTVVRNMKPLPLLEVIAESVTWMRLFM